MASGASVIDIVEVLQPATLYALQALRTGGSTPAEQVLVWSFDPTTTWYLDFKCLLRGYTNGGLTFTLPWTATTATSGTVIWNIGIRRMAESGDDIDTSQTYDYNAAAASTADATSGKLTYPTLTFTHGADMDNWANNEIAIVRVARDVADTMTDTAELWGLVGNET